MLAANPCQLLCQIRVIVCISLLEDAVFQGGFFMEFLPKQEHQHPWVPQSALLVDVLSVYKGCAHTGAGRAGEAWISTFAFPR